MTSQVQKFRHQYPHFIYESYSFKTSDTKLEITFNFRTEPNISFHPKIIIENIDKSHLRKTPKEILTSLIFHLGLIEMLSYWKATCSPIIEIKSGFLNKNQIKWWKNLILKGMGQFFYENKINFKDKNFLTIVSSPLTPTSRLPVSLKSKESVLIPVGGGKDSFVTLELLRKSKKRIGCFILQKDGNLSPTKTKEILKKLKIPTIIVRRRIDKKLLKLNQQGFLNGHTPFSAYLAFLSLLIAALFRHRYIAFSNERSSNEGNLKYLNTEINHQWSKSFEFEKTFRNYYKKYLIKNIEYFSFLRPLYEIQIAELFTQYKKYFPYFLSCNNALRKVSKREKWCGKCSKCLFVFTILSPFLSINQLIKIFKKNLFEERGFLPIMEKLIGIKDSKPFECVGTLKENQLAFYLAWKKNKKERKKPFLLNYFEKKILPIHQINPKKLIKKFLYSWDDRNFLPSHFKKILKKEILTGIKSYRK